MNPDNVNRGMFSSPESLDNRKEAAFEDNGDLKEPSSDREESSPEYKKVGYEAVKEKVGNENMKGLKKKRSAATGQRPKKRTRICRSDDDFKPIPICILKRPKTIVDHSYYDYSGYKEKCDDIIDYSSDTSEKRELSFGLKLHEILDKYSNYICWQPHGRAFKISIPKRFEMKVCPKYYGHSRYSTFLRQLNNHGFKHITQGRDRNCYYHETFLRGIPSATKFMPPPSNRRRLTPDPANEPDLYRISVSFPLKGQTNHESTGVGGEVVYQNEKIRSSPRDTIMNRIENFQSSSSGNSSHGLSLNPLPSLSYGAAHVASANAMPQTMDNLASSVLAKAMIDQNQQLEATRERIIENLRKEKAMSDLLNQIRQQDLVSTSLLGPSMTVDYNSTLLDMFKIGSMERFLSEGLNPNVSSNIQPMPLDTSSMLLALQSRALPTVNQDQDNFALQLLKQFQANNNPLRDIL